MQRVEKFKSRWFVVLIAVVVFACFLPTLKNGFVWDDHYNLVENMNYRGLSWSHLQWMFTTFHDDNYHPLAWLSLAFDYMLWGMEPSGYHFSNIMLHVMNAILFYVMTITLLLKSRTVSGNGRFGAQLGALVGALFFGVHPLRVETVAWISTRGDLLCGIFYMSTIIAYVRAVDTEAIHIRRKWFLLAMLFFVLSLLSRAWGMTLPLVLLILDVYPLGRFKKDGPATTASSNIWFEKIPFVGFALGGAIIAFWAKKGAMLNVAQHGVLERMMQAAFGLVFYLRKTLLPIGLYPGYLLDKKMDPLAPGFILCAFFILAMTTGLILMRHRWPWALSAWLCYAVTVSPLLGFVQSGLHIAADRYTYISCMPFAVLAGAGMQRIWVARQRERLAAAGWFSVLALVGASVMILSVMSFRQTRIWHNNFTFWNYIIKSDPNNYLAYNNRGVLLKERKKDLKGALEDYDTAIALYPEYAGAYYNRGLLHEERGDWADAIADYSSVIRLDPKHAQAYNNRGILRNRQGDLAGAMADLNEAIRLAPFSPEAYANRGMIRLAQNDLQGGVQDLAKALEVASVNWPSRKQVEKILANLSQRLKTQD